MKTNKIRFSTLVTSAVGISAITSSQAVTVLLEDDFSDLSNFTSVVHGGAVDWTSDGTEASFTVAASSGGSRASLRSNTAFDFNPFVGMEPTVVLEFTTSISDIDPEPDVNRFEVALVDNASVADLDQPLAFETNVYGHTFTHTSDYNPAGLFFNDAVGGRPGTGASDIGITAEDGMRTFRIEFSETQTELFVNGVSAGTSANVLDLNRDYNINIFAQDPVASTRAIQDVSLSVVTIPEPSSASLALLAVGGMLIRRKR